MIELTIARFEIDWKIIVIVDQLSRQPSKQLFALITVEVLHIDRFILHHFNFIFLFDARLLFYSQ